MDADLAEGHGGVFSNNQEQTMISQLYQELSGDPIHLGPNPLCLNFPKSVRVGKHP